MSNPAEAEVKSIGHGDEMFRRRLLVALRAERSGDVEAATDAKGCDLRSLAEEIKRFVRAHRDEMLP